MKLRQVMVMAVAASAASAFGTAAAQPSERFQGFDRNGDGYLAKSELGQVPEHDAAFAEADENRDGRLSSDEFIKFQSIHDRQRAGKYIGDAALTAKVKTALLREKDLKAMDVNVETSEGRVLLSGWVANEDQRKRALNVASRVDGVKTVKDGMIVR